MSDIVGRLRGNLSVMEAFPDIPISARTMAGVRQSIEIAIAEIARLRALNAELVEALALAKGEKT